MITKKDFLEVIEELLNDGKVETKPLTEIDAIRSIYEDDYLINLFYVEFLRNYCANDNEDMLVAKTQDFIYNLNMAIGEWLKPIHGLNTIEEIKSACTDLIFREVDLYSAVSYDESDKEMIEEWEATFPKKKI